METPTLTTMAPPEEPKLAYPDPLPSSVEPIALIRGTTFFAATRGGDLLPPGAPQIGLFHNDTRFLSRFELRVNGQQPMALSSTTVDADNSRVELTVRGGSVPGENLDLPVNTVYIHREQLLDSARFYDVLELQSFHDQEVPLTIELRFAADFMDIFQVRGLLRGKSGNYFQPEIVGSNVRLMYEGLDQRTRLAELCFDPQPQKLEGDRAVWQRKLPPRGRARLSTTISMHVSGEAEPIPETSLASRPTFEEMHARSTMQNADRRQSCTHFRSDNEIFDVLLRTSTEDFHSLRMPEPAGTAVAAGVPWFAALFGRDSLISSFETLMLDPELACGTLRVLASYQGNEINDERDEDPGKILHERRSGEMTATNEVAFGRSYGSVDSTPLFLILAQEYYRWTADKALLVELKTALKAATNWILHYGDLDGDGLIEYCRRNPKGLFNQGWKDSGDANRHADGRIAQPPVALVEVQGYCVRAMAAAAEVLNIVGESEISKQAAATSEQVRRLIEKRFWLEDRGFYAMALDRHKAPLRVDSSNPGHLLFAQAISANRARVTARRLLSDGLFSGWGIRTLSSVERYYNPMSYHCGSVWPHDNALIGYGMALYGLHEGASEIFQALFDTALHFRDYRLPELFCGVERLANGEPVHYPVSCSPQAWAAGAPFLLLTGLLGLRPAAERGELLIVDPHLPPFLTRLRLDNLRVGPARLSLEFTRDGERTQCNVVDVRGKGIKVSIVFASPPR
ncbi:MAG TPA: glycogen debranching N-terminal domain-containing protein [Silvibacterium sp.]|nr:glycogen debranching N-terminal domain-containing protein [Silvibacterium sp.]